MILAAAPLAQAGEYRLAGETLQFKVSLNLAPHWNGVLNIEEISIDPSGSVEIHNLSLADQKGRNWLTIKSARCAYISDQNNLKLTDVRIEQPRVTLWFDKGQLNLPLQQTWSEGSDITPSWLKSVRHLTITDAALTITGEDFSFVRAGFSFEAAQEGGNSKYLVRLTRRMPQSTVNAEGTVDISSQEVDLDVRADHMLDRQESAAILQLLDVPLIHDVNCELTANLRFAGSLGDSATLWPVGYIVIKNGTANGNGGRLLEDLRSRITFWGKKQMAFDTIEGFALNGRFQGSGFLVVRRDDTVWFGGHVAAQNVDLARFSAAIGNPKFLTKGTASVRYDFTATSRDVAEHKGRGAVFLDDADLWKMPVVSHLFSFMGIPLVYSDGLAYFKTKGPVVIFQEARITSPTTAIELQKDFYVDVKTEFIDGHAVFVPLKKLRAIEQMIPFLRIFTNVRDTLTRVSIRGYWSEPPSQLIHKDVLRDISASTMNFFEDAAQSGGQIGTDIMSRLQPFFRTTTTSETALEVDGNL
jgi:hypothetical protein